MKTIVQLSLSHSQLTISCQINRKSYKYLPNLAKLKPYLWGWKLKIKVADRTFS